MDKGIHVTHIVPFLSLFMCVGPVRNVGPVASVGELMSL